jgi:hypothetical protein
MFFFIYKSTLDVYQSPFSSVYALDPSLETWNFFPRQSQTSFPSPYA